MLRCIDLDRQFLRHYGKRKNDQKELQLTDAIQKLIDFGGNISAILLNENNSVIDIGTADSYLETTKNFKLIL